MKEKTFYETSVDYLTCDNFAIFYSNEAKWVRKMRTYAEERPDEVHITQDNDWGLIAKIPKSWMSVRPPARRTFTEEQKKEMRDRLAAARKSK